MLNIIKAELFKLKHSKILLFTMLCAFAAPFLTFFEFYSYKMTNSALTISFEEIFNQTLLFDLGLFSIMLFLLIVSYLFLSEFRNNTLKLVLAVPVSKNKFILSKIAVFLLWVILIAILTFVGDLIFGVMASAYGFSLNLALSHLFNLIIGSFCLYLAIMPFIFVILVAKNIIPISICAFLLAVINILIYNMEYAIYSPWLAPALLISGEYVNYSGNVLISVGIILAVAIIGIVLSLFYFNKKDISF